MRVINQIKINAPLEFAIKVQIWMDDLYRNVKDLESLKRQRDEIEDWIDKQQLVVTDWLSKPSKLRPEAIKQELVAMNDLLSNIGDKRTQILTEFSTSREYTNFMEFPFLLLLLALSMNISWVHSPSTSRRRR